MRYSTVAGWREKEASAGGGLPAAPRASQPLTRLDPGPRTQKPRVSADTCASLPTRLLCLNRGPPRTGEGVALDAHTRTQLCFYTHLSTYRLPQISHTRPQAHFAPLASVPIRGASTVHDNSCLLLSPMVVALAPKPLYMWYISNAHGNLERYLLLSSFQS